MARKYFGQTGNRAGELEFSDLPSLLGTKVFQVLKTGSALASFRYVPEQEPDTVYQVTISPVHRAGSAVPSSVLMIVEDRTQSELLRKLEQEAATAKREHELLKDMARKMAERIGNIILPVGIYAEMLGPNWKDAAVRGEIENGLRESALKGLRLAELMRNFEGASGASDQAIPLAQLIDEAVQEAHKHHPKIKVKCQNDFTKRPVFIPGDRKALKLAMTELMLNALQANPKTGTAEIEVTEVSAALGGTVCIEIKDNGPGFTSEARAQAGKPFFSTESAGAGLGLLITSRILERNRGKLEIMESGQQGVVRVTLPVEKPATK
jgi:signal transduction histidine kinase